MVRERRWRLAALLLVVGAVGLALMWHAQRDVKPRATILLLVPGEKSRFAFPQDVSSGSFGVLDAELVRPGAKRVLVAPDGRVAIAHDAGFVIVDPVADVATSFLDMDVSFERFTFHPDMVVATRGELKSVIRLSSREVLFTNEGKSDVDVDASGRVCVVEHDHMYPDQYIGKMIRVSPAGNVMTWDGQSMVFVYRGTIERGVQGVPVEPPWIDDDQIVVRTSHRSSAVYSAATLRPLRSFGSQRILWVHRGWGLAWDYRVREFSDLVEASATMSLVDLSGEHRPIRLERGASALLVLPGDDLSEKR